EVLRGARTRTRDRGWVDPLDEHIDVPSVSVGLFERFRVEHAHAVRRVIAILRVGARAAARPAGAKKLATELVANDGRAVRDLGEAVRAVCGPRRRGRRGCGPAARSSGRSLARTLFLPLWRVALAALGGACTRRGVAVAHMASAGDEESER